MLNNDSCRRWCNSLAGNSTYAYSSKRVETLCLFDSTLIPPPHELLLSTELHGQFLALQVALPPRHIWHPARAPDHLEAVIAPVAPHG
ncbi:hypothetical protein JVT61DRAFT_7625 [Boletus reticuloceps]|uniref:Uncharacterized protein n=1 Tax=Boletus reticuloceps TaxID=495285 RepID=A0A8I2YHR3_9AGAM|nr:hypothetical protein JVT61DRAFT_7625 [Boletus reticuloceps]